PGAPRGARAGGGGEDREGRRALAGTGRGRAGAARRVAVVVGRRGARGAGRRTRDVIETDVLVVGSGLAGLMTALHVAPFADVTVVTKAAADDTNTSHAQGGIAAVFDRRDSFAKHARDTLRCGAGLCDPAVVRAVVRDGPDAVRELESLGVPFTRGPRGFEPGREGGHSARRIV